MRRMRYGTAILVVALLFGVIDAGERLSRPANRMIGAPPERLKANTVVLKTSDDQSIHGWFSIGKPGFGAILLLHGIRGDRREMLSRALMLHEAGFTVLLIDLPAHGESEGTRITFGFREAKGVGVALEFLQSHLPDERIGVIGVSLGAASLVFSKPNPAPSAVVLESMYPTIREAVENRLAMHLGAHGKSLAPLLLWQLPFRLGITADDLRPISDLPNLKAPLLIIAGADDLHTTLSETRHLFDAAQNPKELWIINGAAHVNLHAYSPAAYEAKVVPFLVRHLRNKRWRS